MARAGKHADGQPNAVAAACSGSIFLLLLAKLLKGSTGFLALVALSCNRLEAYTHVYIPSVHAYYGNVILVFCGFLLCLRQQFVGAGATARPEWGRKSLERRANKSEKNENNAAMCGWSCHAATHAARMRRERVITSR